MDNDPEKTSGAHALAIVGPSQHDQEAEENGKRTKIIELDRAARERYADKKDAFPFRPVDPEAA